MPLKLIGFILFIVVIFAFIGFNLDNRTDINIWVNEKGHFENVSIIVVVFAAYLFGLVSTVPFWFARSLSRGRKKAKDKAAASQAAAPPVEKREKKKLLAPRKKNDEDEA